MKRIDKLTIEEMFCGKEPVWNCPEELSLSRALSWYANQQGPKESKKYTIDYVKQYKYSQEIIDKITDAKEYLFLNLGFICRIVMRGANIDKTDIINKKINYILSYEDEVEKKPYERAINVREKIIEQGTVYINEIEDFIECFITGKPIPEFNCYAWLTTNEIKPVYVKQIIDYYTPMLVEMKLVHYKADISLIDGYSTWTKKTIKACYLFLQNLIDTCNGYLDNKKITKKKKTDSSIKKQLKIKYKKEDIDYKIVSVDPHAIFSAKQLWVFNVKYKTLGIYIAADESGFSIKGTTIEGFNVESSIQKVLKKPLDILPKVLGAKKTELKNLMKTITTKESLLTGRINSDVVLLRVLK